MRKIEMRRIDGESPPVIEIVAGRRYLAVLSVPEGTSEARRAKARLELERILPGYVSALVLPHGYTVDVYEDVDPPVPQKLLSCPRCGAAAGQACQPVCPPRATRETVGN